MQSDLQVKSSGFTRRGIMQSVAGALAVNGVLPLARAAQSEGQHEDYGDQDFRGGEPMEELGLREGQHGRRAWWDGERRRAVSKLKLPRRRFMSWSGSSIGEDPLHPERLWQKMHKGLFLGNNVAMNGITIACWDILAKSLNAPLWKLLGGKQNPSLRVYANGWYKGAREPGAFAEEASRVKSMGYTALKFDPFGSTYRFFDSGEEKKSIAIVAAVRKAVGDDMDVLH